MESDIRKLHKQITDLQELVNSPGWSVLCGNLQDLLTYYSNQFLKDTEPYNMFENRGVYKGIAKAIETPENLITELHSQIERLNKADQT